MRLRPLLEALLVLLACTLWSRYHALTGLGRLLDVPTRWNFEGNWIYAVLPLLVIRWGRRSWRGYGLLPRRWGVEAGWGLAVAGAFLAPFLVALAAGWVHFNTGEPVFEALLFQLVWAGVFEEVLYRGYLQTRLDDLAPWRWNLLGVPIGPGFVLASLLFGLTHALNPFDPLRGVHELDWAWGLSALHVGVMLAILRARVGSILPCVIVHGLHNLPFFFIREQGTLLLSIAYTCAWTTLCVMISLTHEPRAGEDAEPG